jgi:hypothetical protein
MSDVIRERILKVLRLAQHGVGGEKENAEVLLEKMLKKHGLTREHLEIDQEARDEVWHPYANDLERELLMCIANAVCQRRVEFFVPRGSRKRVLGIIATPAEQSGIIVLQETYVPTWRKAQKELLVAFALRHDLRDMSPRDEPETPSRLTKAEIERMSAMVQGLEHVDRPRKRIGAGANV